MPSSSPKPNPRISTFCKASMKALRSQWYSASDSSLFSFRISINRDNNSSLAKVWRDHQKQKCHNLVNQRSQSFCKRNRIRYIQTKVATYRWDIWKVYKMDILNEGRFNTGNRHSKSNYELVFPLYILSVVKLTKWKKKLGTLPVIMYTDSKKKLIMLCFLLHQTRLQSARFSVEMLQKLVLLSGV